MLYSVLSSPLKTVLASLYGGLVRWTYDFDGSDDLASFSTPIDLTGDFDVAVIVEGVRNTGNGHDFVGTETKFKISLDPATGAPSFLVGNGTGWVVQHQDSTTYLYNGKRYHIRATRVGNVYTMYVNGVQKYQVTNASATSAQITHVGRRSSGAISFVGGKILSVYINGVAWHLNQQGHLMQLPEPSGVGNIETVANHKFQNATTTDLPSWTRSNSSTYSYDGSWLKISNSATQDGSIQQAITTVAGKTYLVEFATGPFTTTTHFRLAINNGPPAWTGSISAQVYAPNRKHRIIFTAGGATTGIAIFTNSVVVGASITLSGLSIKEILPTTNPLTLSTTTVLSRWSEVDEYQVDRTYPVQYDFDGSNDQGVLAFRAIDPEGDIDIEWKQSALPAATHCHVVNQNIASGNGSREFTLYINPTTKKLEMVLGGVVVKDDISVTDYTTAGAYRVFVTGSNIEFYKDGVLAMQKTQARGSAREPLARTTIAARNNDSVTAFTDFFRARLYDVKINGVLYPINEHNQIIQTPQPVGLGSELITQSVLENPAVKGAHWTYLGDGRWRLVSDGTYSALTFINSSSQPDSGFIEFDIESISGGSIRCSEGSAITSSQFSTIGTKRWYFVTKDANNSFTFARQTDGVAVTAIIKNISFKSLWTPNATQLVTNGTFSSGSSGWTQIGTGGTISVSGGELTMSGGTSVGVRQSVTREVGKHYVLSFTARRTAGTAALSFSIFGSGSTAMGVTIPDTQSTVSAVIMASASTSNLDINIVGDSSTTSWVISNVSVRKIDTLHNPLVLNNTTADRWKQVI